MSACMQHFHLCIYMPSVVVTFIHRHQREITSHPQAKRSTWPVSCHKLASNQQPTNQPPYCSLSHSPCATIVANEITTGTQLKELHEFQAGASSLCFAHHDMSILFAGSDHPHNRKQTPSGPNEAQTDDHPVRYLSLHDNQYLHLYCGHRSPISSISLFPVHSSFLSGSSDGQVRLWDLRQADARLCVNPAADAESGELLTGRWW
jgi:WD40 repeat protein